MVIFTIAFWFPVTRQLTRAITKMTQATEAIAQGNFNVTAPAERSDELGRLGRAINNMAQRLSGFITGQRRFLGDVAHELCSPLARMELALAILHERTDARTQAYVQDVQEEVTHMRKLAHELLNFAKASVSSPSLQTESTNLREVVESALKTERVDPLKATVAVADDLVVVAVPNLLTRAIANLIRNAVRYGDDRPVEIEARATSDLVVLSIADKGPGVPAEELERIFEPFYRTDTSRDSESGGVGLGLAIVKTCLEACSAKVRAKNRDPHGLEVQIALKKAVAPTL